MCELLALNSSRPVDAGPYLHRLMPRGGRLAPHADGWGVAYFDGRASRIFKDASPAADSRHLALLACSGLASTAVVAHIRKANPSAFGRTTANTHPFEREWNGRSWVFAHNGKLSGMDAIARTPPRRFSPVGHTDSELAFCHLLDTLDREIGCGGEVTPLGVKEVLAPAVERLSRLGEFNFILSEGSFTLAHAHTRLHLLESRIGPPSAGAPVVVLATAPLTEHGWTALAPGTLQVYENGCLSG